MMVKKKQKKRNIGRKKITASLFAFEKAKKEGVTFLLNGRSYQSLSKNVIKEVFNLTIREGWRYQIG